MHKNGKFIPLLALGFTFFLSGCDYFADKHLVEEMKEQQKEQETKINLLEKQQKDISYAQKWKIYPPACVGIHILFIW
ncbi:hypothetical protein ACV2HH_14210, partial [Salmonella enterica subsp. enterica serovar Gallinarum]